MTISKAIIAVLLLGFALAGCGQSGPLYLPGNPSEVQSVGGGQPGSQAPQNRTDERDDDDEEDDGG
ncbi:MAG: lipoprotein [Woeseiaceae bacterium]|nr:lipoprotein [Woeseiaceae bacterium]